MGQFVDELLNSQDGSSNTQSSQPTNQTPVKPTISHSNNQNTPNKINIQPNKIKKGEKVSGKGFLIGCLIFFFVIVFIAFLAFFIIAKNPNTVKSLGISVSTLSSIIWFLAILFFGFLAIISLFIIVLNGYKLSTQKENKNKYAIGTFLGIILLFSTIGFGAFSFINISKIGESDTVQATNILSALVRVNIGNKEEYIETEKGIKFIAPSYMAFRLNKELFRKSILNKLPVNIKPLGFEVDCGNGQNIKGGDYLLGKTNIFLDEKGNPALCLYTEKKSYEIKLKFYYDENGIQKEQSYDVFTMTPDAKISLKSNGQAPSLNDNKDELVLGKVPANIVFDASEIFTDLKISDNEINWDFNEDFKPDSTKSKAMYTFKKPKLYKIYYNLPTLAGWENVYYIIDIRLKETDNVNCNVNIAQKYNNQYAISVDFEDPIQVDSYNFQIKDAVNNIVLKEIQSSKPQVYYELEDGGTYKVIVSYKTNDGKTGTCESQDYETKAPGYKISYGFLWKQKDYDDFKNLDSLSGDEIDISSYPSTLRLEIKSVLPRKDGDYIAVTLDGKEVLPTEKDKYDFKIDTQKEYKIVLEVKNNGETRHSKTFKVIVKKKPLVAILKATPNAGTEPLIVELDASTSDIGELGDEILYFTWDFGDGNMYTNVSQGKVTHTYKYDTEKNMGVYTAKVKVMTKKGYEDTATARISVTQKIKDAKIMVAPPFSNQVARTSDPVTFNAEVEGNIKSMTWDFGDGNKISGEGREYSSVTHTYQNSGFYNVKLIIEFEDSPAITSTIKMKIIE